MQGPKHCLLNRCIKVSVFGYSFTWCTIHFSFFPQNVEKRAKKATKPKKNLPPLSRATQYRSRKFFQRSTLEGLNFVTWVSDCKISDIKDDKTASPNPVSEWFEIVFLFHLFRFISTKYSLHISRFIILFTIHCIASLNSIGYTA